MDIRLYVDRFLPTRTIERELKREYGSDFFSVLDQGKDRIRGNFIDIEADPSVLSDIQFFQGAFSVNDVDLFESVNYPLDLRVREDTEIPGTDILLEKDDLIRVEKKEIKESHLDNFEYDIYYTLLEAGTTEGPGYILSELKTLILSCLHRARKGKHLEIERAFDIAFDAMEKAEREAERYFR